LKRQKLKPNRLWKRQDLIEVDVAKIAYQPNSEVLPLIETERFENQRLHIELGNFASEKELLKQELVEV
jgi:hypothetical protein